MVRPLFLFWFANRGMANDRLKEAERLEAKGEFKDACYSYALALHLGVGDQAICRQKIASIWQVHRPFDFSDISKRLEDQKDGCGLSGHEATMVIIRSIIEQKKSGYRSDQVDGRLLKRGPGADPHTLWSNYL